jgi:peptidoglycan/LPS O-acetylase OafA/YrhL
VAVFDFFCGYVAVGSGINIAAGRVIATTSPAFLVTKMITTRYVFLDGMRGIAAFVVLAVHVASIFGLPAIFASGELSVDLFFCLSGFVVAKAYDGKVQDRGFVWLMKRRVVRLYPMIVLSITISAVLAFMQSKADIAILSGAALVLFPISLITGGVLAFPLNLPMWSLFFEMAGSIGYGLERNRLNERGLRGLVVAAGCVLAVTMALGHVQNFGVGGKLSFLVGFARMIYPFAIGVLFARMNIKVPSITNWRLALALVALFAIPGSKFHVALCCLVLLPTMVLLGSNARTTFAPAWDWLGRISYPLYLLHVPILEAARYFLAGWPLYAVIPLAVGLTVAASMIALSIYDEPLRAWLGRAGRPVTPTARGAR